MDIEKSLQLALRPEEPAPDFTRRVMARVAAESQLRRRARWRVPLALAASLVVVAVGLGVVQQQRETQRLHSARQLALALEITSSQLNQVQQKLNHPQTTENGI
jgi:anti-sigma-K factor RskA